MKFHLPYTYWYGVCEVPTKFSVKITYIFHDRITYLTLGDYIPFWGVETWGITILNAEWFILCNVFSTANMTRHVFAEQLKRPSKSTWEYKEILTALIQNVSIKTHYIHITTLDCFSPFSLHYVTHTNTHTHTHAYTNRGTYLQTCTQNNLQCT